MTGNRQLGLIRAWQADGDLVHQRPARQGTACVRCEKLAGRVPLVLVMLVIAHVSLLSSRTTSAADPRLEAREEAAFVQAAALLNPSIVRIQTFGGLDRVGGLLTATGPTTGVVVSADGYIISSSFNFVSKPASILVQLHDGRRFPARVIAGDRLKMLTLLKIDADGLQPAEAADKSSIRVGQWAIAMGRTYDQPLPSISIGVVSAVERIWGKAIQTDAKVSPVNYGGPLADVGGKVLGVLVPLSPSGESETAGVEWYDSGIGFAIPMQEIYATLDRLQSGEDLFAGLMGVALKRTRRLDEEPTVDRVRYGSPADKAGLEPGDLILEVDGQPVKRHAEVKHVLGNKYAGDQISLTVRRGEETLERELTLVAELLPYESGFLGILPERRPLDAEQPAGVGVRYVYSDSPAGEAGIEQGDRIVRFGKQPVTDAESLTELVSRLRPGETVDVAYVRTDAEKTVSIVLASLPDTVPGDLRPTAIAPPLVPAGGQEGEQDGDKQAEETNSGDRPKTGRFTVEMPSHRQSYWAYVPSDYNPEYSYGLVVWIHPAGDTMEAAILRQWQRICDRRGLLLLAPKASTVEGWNLNDAEFVKDAVGEFVDDYSVDLQRICLHGYSDGGTFAYHLAFKYRSLFRGAAVAGAHMLIRPPDNEPDYRLQLHLVCGENDRVHPAVEATVRGLKRLRYPVSFTSIREQDDGYPPAEHVEEIGRWVDCLDRI